MVREFFAADINGIESVGRHDVIVIAENGGGIDGKRCASLEARKRFYGIIIKKVHDC